MAFFTCTVCILKCIWIYNSQCTGYHPPPYPIYAHTHTHTHTHTPQIFNLSERSYDITNFNNQVLDFGWPDHLAPSLERLSRWALYRTSILAKELAACVTNWITLLECVLLFTHPHTHTHSLTHPPTQCMQVDKVVVGLWPLPCGGCALQRGQRSYRMCDCCIHALHWDMSQVSARVVCTYQCISLVMYEYVSEYSSLGASESSPWYLCTRHVTFVIIKHALGCWGDPEVTCSWSV